MASRSNASRANGAKSKGPSTPEGKARSSQNARKHGLTARFDILPDESLEDFDSLLEAHLAQYQPSGDVEKELVHTLAITRWRLRRVPTLESDVFDLDQDGSISQNRKTAIAAASGSLSAR
jgi:hypothetical protein